MQPRVTFNKRGALVSCLAWILLVASVGLSAQAAGSLQSEQFQRQKGTSCLPLTSLPEAASSTLRAIRSGVECANLCAQDGQCVAFVHSAIQAVCHLLNDVAQMTASCDGDDGEVWKTWVRAVATDMPDPNPTEESPQCQNGGEDGVEGGCQCFHGFVGDYCERLMQDCQEAKDHGYTLPSSMILLTAQPRLSPHNMTVMCRGNGQTVILRRDALFPDALNYTWEEFVEGIPLPINEGSHFIGLRNLYYLSNSKPYKLSLIIRRSDPGKTFAHIDYGSFRVVDDVTFKAELGPFTYGEEDLLGDMNDSPFSAYDHNHGNSDYAACLQRAGGGWWFGSTCASTNYNLVGKVTGVESGAQPSMYAFYGNTTPPGLISHLTFSLEN